MRRRLVVFAKRPLPGQAKTRLGAAIGPEQAAGVYARLLYSCLEGLCLLPGVERVLAVADEADRPFFAAAFPEFALSVQPGGDLGARLAAAFREAFEAGARAAVVVASDTPGLDGPVVAAAFAALERAPVVVGPCLDGGYYLLGQIAPGAPLFTNVAWGGKDVLEQTERLARAQGLVVARLPELRDIDTAGDLALWLGGPERLIP